MCFLNDYDPAVLAGSLEDFFHKHQNSYVVNEDGSIGYIRNSLGAGVLVECADSTKHYIWEYKIAPAPFKRIARQRKLFNTSTLDKQQKLAIMTNNPERRNRLGFCASTVVSYGIARKDRAAQLTMSLVDDYVKGGYVALVDALQGDVSVAIDPQWAITKVNGEDPETPINVLRHFFVPVAIIKGEKISVANKLFEEEVLDFVRKNELPFIVKRT